MRTINVMEADMTYNVGGVDRAVRLLAGLVLVSLVFVGPQTPWGWIGLILIATAGLNWCPIYAAAGLNTYPVKHGKKDGR
jgi:Protein of unknown function (DUF2892)